MDSTKEVKTDEGEQIPAEVVEEIQEEVKDTLEDVTEQTPQPVETVTEEVEEHKTNSSPIDDGLAKINQRLDILQEMVEKNLKGKEEKKDDETTDATGTTPSGGTEEERQTDKGKGNKSKSKRLHIFRS